MPCEILILEDETLIAMDIEMSLQAQGFDGIVVCQSSAAALDQIARDPPRAALLDVNLGSDTTSLPVATELRGRGIPFAFLTGYTDRTYDIPDDLSDVERIAKPFDEAALRHRVTAMLEDVGG